MYEAAGEIVACGGWSRRNKLFNASTAGADERLLDPATEPARIRAMFVRGDWTRRGLGRGILTACVDAARAEGFTRLALMATLPGVPLYKAFGFTEVEPVDLPMPDGVVLEGARWNDRSTWRSTHERAERVHHPAQSVSRLIGARSEARTTMSSGTKVSAPDGTEVVLGEIGTRVLLKNSRVRVWEVSLQPGEAQGWHLHHNPYVVLCLSTSPCHMDWLDGSPARQLSETVGGSVYRPVSPVHMLTNDGSALYLNRLIEILDLGEEASGDPYFVVAGVPADAGFEEVGEIPAKVVVDEDTYVSSTSLRTRARPTPGTPAPTRPSWSTWTSTTPTSPTWSPARPTPSPRSPTAPPASTWSSCCTTASRAPE